MFTHNHQQAIDSANWNNDFALSDSANSGMLCTANKNTSAGTACGPGQAQKPSGRSVPAGPRGKPGRVVPSSAAGLLGSSGRLNSPQQQPHLAPPQVTVNELQVTDISQGRGQRGEPLAKGTGIDLRETTPLLPLLHFYRRTKPTPRTEQRRGPRRGPRLPAQRSGGLREVKAGPRRWGEGPPTAHTSPALAEVTGRTSHAPPDPKVARAAVAAAPPAAPPDRRQRQRPRPCASPRPAPRHRRPSAGNAAQAHGS